MNQEITPERRAESEGGFPRRSRDWPVGPLTAVLIAISVGVAFYSRLGANERALEFLFLTNYHRAPGELPVEISQGEVWRLITPIFIHFGYIHLLFNLLWLKDLGTVIEKGISSRFLFTFVLVIGISSNVAQFLYSGPFFGGMSGVVYGLLGYVWMKSIFDPGSGFYLDKQTVIMMLGWFALCSLDVIKHVANAAHAAGLGLGVIWGYFAATAAARNRIRS
jgi:GlpG protein